MNWFEKTLILSSETIKTMISTTNEHTIQVSGSREGVIFESADELIDIFHAEYKGVPAGMVFEQGGFLAKGSRGWVLCMPSKTIRLKAATDLGRFSQINFGFYGMNRAGEEGILLKVSERVPTQEDAVLKQGLNLNNGKSVLQTMFFPEEEVILHNGESFAEFVLRLKHNGDLAKLDVRSLRGMLAEAKYVEPEIDNATGDITDEYRYVPLVLEIEALGSPREIIHGKNWRDANRTNKYVHTHLPTQGDWNEIMRIALKDERDELNTPTDILAVRYDIQKVNAPEGASSTIVTFEYDGRPRTLRTFVLDLLSKEEQEKLFALARKHKTSLMQKLKDMYKDEVYEIAQFYKLVQKGTVKGLPESLTVAQAMRDKKE